MGKRRYAEYRRLYLQHADARRPDTEKRIDITLYQSKNKREEANSSYAVYADFVERFLKLIEKNPKELFVRILSVSNLSATKNWKLFVIKHLMMKII